MFEELLENYLRDTRKARVLRADGNYMRPFRHNAQLVGNGSRFNVQDFFLSLAESAQAPLGNALAATAA
jgi:hypothetical protein